KLCSETSESSQLQLVQLHDFPGGVEAFELCAKFCYGITITLSAYNIVSIRCAAEYLQMTEEAEKGNLIYKLEVFFNSCILHGWGHNCDFTEHQSFPFMVGGSWITGRCIEALASKVLSHPSKVSLSHSYSRRGRDDVSCNGSESHRHKPTTSKGWWGEDLAELGIDLYWRTMIAIKSGGKVPTNLIGDALRIYASQWLPNISKYIEKQDESDSELGEVTTRHRLMLESLVSLLPAERGSVSCSFLLKLLKAANILKASSSTRQNWQEELGFSWRKPHWGQSPPTSPPRNKGKLERQRSRSAENIDLEFQERRRSSSASHSCKLKVAKLVDAYLQEIAKDKNLPLSKFIAIAEAIPEFARLDHDNLYKAIDIYLKDVVTSCPKNTNFLDLYNRSLMDLLVMDQDVSTVSTFD
ncbi:UNVERIFIED_CONTAM: BTB/POZ domain-containing protein, partial [Sesamum latifolium]